MTNKTHSAPFLAAAAAAMAAIMLFASCLADSGASSESVPVPDSSNVPGASSQASESTRPDADSEDLETSKNSESPESQESSEYSGSSESRKAPDISSGSASENISVSLSPSEADTENVPDAGSNDSSGIQPADSPEQISVPDSAAQSPGGFHQWTSGSAPASVRELYDAINYYRTENGLSQLLYITEIQYSADTRAGEAASCWSHTRPDGRPDHSIFDDMGISDYLAYGENLAKFDSSYGLMQSLSLWKESPTHNENLLRGTFTGMCIGVCFSGGETYCALLFTE